MPISSARTSSAFTASTVPPMVIADRPVTDGEALYARLALDRAR